jgi:hypothetical protein
MFNQYRIPSDVTTCLRNYYINIVTSLCDAMTRICVKCDGIYPLLSTFLKYGATLTTQTVIQLERIHFRAFKQIQGLREGVLQDVWLMLGAV